MPSRGAPPGRQPLDFPPVEADGAGADIHEAHERAQQGGLAHAVMAEDADEFALLDIELDPMQDRNRPVVSPASRVSQAAAFVSFPEIDLLHLRMRHDLLDMALDEDAPAVEHGDRAGDVLDEVHVVLDDDQRVVAGEAAHHAGGGARAPRPPCPPPARRAAPGAAGPASTMASSTSWRWPWASVPTASPAISGICISSSISAAISAARSARFLRLAARLTFS